MGRERMARSRACGDGDDGLTYTADDKLKCIEREVHMRLRVYPRWVEQGRITAEKAARETALMTAIAQDYRRLAERERLL